MDMKRITYTDCIEVAQLASRMKLSPMTIRNWIHAGIIKARRKGLRQFVIHKDEANRIVEEQQKDFIIKK